MTARRLAFYTAVVLTLGVAGLFAGMVVLMNVRPGFLGMTHFAEEHHRVHDVAFAALNGVTVIGMLAQLRSPHRSAAALLMALIPFAALWLAVLATNTWVLSPPWLIVGVGAVVATMFHPVGDPLRAFAQARADRALLALSLIAAVPLLAYAWTNVLLQRAGPSDHAIQGHYGYMAALAFAVVATAVLASVRPAGGRPIAWVAGAIAATLGGVSLLYPRADSALSAEWALAVTAWGGAFVAVAEFRRAQTRMASNPR